MQMTRSFLGTVCKLKGNNQVTGRNPDPHSLRWITDYLPAQLSISQKRLATCGMVGSALATLNLHWGFGIFPFSLPFLVLSPPAVLSLPVWYFPSHQGVPNNCYFLFPSGFCLPRKLFPSHFSAFGFLGFRCQQQPQQQQQQQQHCFDFSACPVGGNLPRQRLWRRLQPVRLIDSYVNVSTPLTISHIYPRTSPQNSAIYTHSHPHLCNNFCVNN